MEENILAIWPKDETEALAAVVPLDFRFDGLSAALVIFGKHVLSYPYFYASPDGMLGRYRELWHRHYEKASENPRKPTYFAPKRMPSVQEKRAAVNGSMGISGGRPASSCATTRPVRAPATSPT